MGIFDRIAEEKIRQAIENGEFEKLEGFGKPVDNNDYFNAPPEERITWHILKNSGVVPEEVELHRQIYQLLQEIKQESDPQITDRKKEELEKFRTRLMFMSEKRKNKF